MTREQLRALCLSLPGAAEDFPFGEDVAVLRVGGKIFALLPLTGACRVNLKCDPDRAVDLRHRYSAVQPGRHMNKRHWNTVDFATGRLNEATELQDDAAELPDDEIAELIEHSHELVFAALPRRQREAIEIQAAAALS